MKLTISKRDYKVELITDLKDCRYLIKHLTRDLSKSKWSRSLGFDIETAPKPEFIGHGRAGLEPNLTNIQTVQFYLDGDNNVYVTQLCKFNADKDYKLFKDIFGDLLKKAPVYAHNAMFEYRHCLDYGVEIKRINCSMILFNLLIVAAHAPREDSNVKKTSAALASLSKVSCGYEMSKDIRDTNWASDDLTEDQVIYAAADAVVTILGSNWCLNQMKSRGIIQDLLKFYNVNIEALPVIAKMSNGGIHLSKKIHNKYILDWKKNLDKSQESLYNILPKGINLRSPPQVSNWIIESLSKVEGGQKIIDGWVRSEKTKNLKTDSENLALHADLPFVKDLLAFKKAQKLYTTYGPTLQNCINPVSKRIHPSFTQCWTGTGRMSSMQPNIQQTPRGDLRDIYRPQSKGWMFVGADLSQIEVRVAAYHSKDPVMMQAYEKGYDLYVRYASNVLSKPESKITNSERQFFKAILLGSLFGLGPNTMLKYLTNMGITNQTIEDCQTAIYGFRETFPVFRQWQLEVSGEAELSLTSYTRMGKVRKLPADNYYCKSMNHPIQSDAAAILLRALRNVGKLLSVKEMQSFPVVAVHDEIILESPKKEVEEAQRVLTTSMEEAMHFVFPEATLSGLVEAKVGDSWGNVK